MFADRCHLEFSLSLQSSEAPTQGAQSPAAWTVWLREAGAGGLLFESVCITWELAGNADSLGHHRRAEPATLGEVGPGHLSFNKPPADWGARSDWRRFLGISALPTLPDDPAAWPWNVTNPENVLSMSPLVWFSVCLFLHITSLCRVFVCPAAFLLVCLQICLLICFYCPLSLCPSLPMWPLLLLLSLHLSSISLSFCLHRLLWFLDTSPRRGLARPVLGPGHPSESAPAVFDDSWHSRLLLRLHAPSLHAPQLNRLRLWTLAGQRHGESGHFLEEPREGGGHP